MCKTVIKNDLETFDNEIRDLIMLEDSTHGTLCAIHKTINSTDNFPHSNHQMLRLCPSFSGYHSKIPIRSRQNKSPNYRQRLPKTSAPKNVCRHASTIAPYHCPNAGHVLSVMNIEKTLSCPGNMYYENSSNRNCGMSSKSSLQIDCKLAQSLVNTDEVVCELKDEIERIKVQLKHKTDTKPQNKIEDEAFQLVKLKNENKRLKREVEAKKKLLEASRKDVDKARDILGDYEKKVSLLHAQAIKSSKAMKASKEKFCKCLSEKDDTIRCLKENNSGLVITIEETRRQYNRKEEECEQMKAALEETIEKCSALKETNQNFCECIESLKQELDKSATESEEYKSSVKKLEQKLCNLNSACKKIMSKMKRQKEHYEQQLKNRETSERSLSEQVSFLSDRLTDVNNQKMGYNQLKTHCDELEKKLKQYERYSEKCQCLEEECKKQYELIIQNERAFEKRRNEMQNLVDELTTVVNNNKVSLLQMSEINKQQQMLIRDQSVALMTKEEQLELLGKQSENFKRRSEELEKEVGDLRRSLSEPCSKDACLCISKELQELRRTLSEERDNHLLKEKIIEDQSQTILRLQHQVKDRLYELNKAHSDAKYLEQELMKINEQLHQKHKELDKQMDEKDNLIEKLKILEGQKKHLAREIDDFEDMLANFRDTDGDDEHQEKVLADLKNQIEEQRNEWECQRENLAKEKQRAVYAAKFATKKLLETTAEFQMQVDAQKKVQTLLTKMLHDKDEQLKIVSSKMSNINAITSQTFKENVEPMQELYRRNMDKIVSSNPTTTTSFYSSCSSCCKAGAGRRQCETVPCATINNLFDSLNLSVEQPIRDF
ncbi:golgin subfamily A member 6-like protein 7 [Cylas formicarius]|uniref:golgin subfamily A member 6-like protein 7 n=1 Tax=Cylas formicarius TaxID=197179 RepID=UPI002958B764|nr:golgin subfamily A member 6-like protein 7 [Cylas formicarius]